MHILAGFASKENVLKFSVKILLKSIKKIIDNFLDLLYIVVVAMNDAKIFRGVAQFG